MFWRFIKALPKVALVLGMFVVSTGMFAYWWYFRSPVKREEQRIVQERKQEIIAKKVAIAEERMGRLFLAGGSLYDVDSGEAIFTRWLNGETPLRLSYDAAAKKLIAQFPRGFVRYNLDGSHDTEMGVPTPALFSKDLKSLVYAKNKDVWRADVDWKAFRFVNERQITKLGVFLDQFFAQNVELLSDKFLMFRNMNKLLRVNLETGEVVPTKIAMTIHSKHRSPDGRFLLGMIGFATGKFSTYDLDSDKTETDKIGRTAFNDSQWLDNDRCAILFGGKTVAIYDRKQGKLGEVCALDGHFTHIGVPSPDGRHVLCEGTKELVLVDVNGRKSESLPRDGKGWVWLGDNALMYSREILDTNQRGTWLKILGGEEKRITPEPFFVSRQGQGAILQMKDAGVVIVETRAALMKMKPDGSGLSELSKLNGPVERLQSIEAWKIPLN